MKPKRNKSWIAGAIVAACVLVVACIVALPKTELGEAGANSNRIPSAVSPGELTGLVNQPEMQQAAKGTDQYNQDAYGGLEYEPGIVLVTLPLGITPSQAVASIAAETGIERLALADETDAEARAATGAESQLRIELSVGSDMPMEEAVSLIGSSSAVDAAQPNFIYHLNDSAAKDTEEAARDRLIAQNLIVQDLVAQASVNDTHVNDQWGLKSIYAYGNNTSSDSGNAWDQVTTGKAVTVAVIDEGFQADHPDLKDNVVEVYNAANSTNRKDVSEVSGQNGHGTHVAGIVSAVANNGIGVAGVSYNAKLLLIKGMSPSGGFSSSNLAAGMDYARSKKDSYNLRVINMCIGGGTTSTSTWKDDVLIKAIDNATDEGIVVVCSAGNSFTDGNGKTWTPPYIDYPADYKNVVSVINLKENGSDPHNVSRNSTSNYNAPSTTESSMNTGKNISAPGTNIYSTYPTSYMSSGYGNNTGTSMAAPHVAGVLALMFAKDSSLTASEATSLLYSTATDIGDNGWDAETGYGEVNAYRAVTNTDAHITSSTTSVQVGKTITLSASRTASNWTSSNTNVATVSNGVVTGVSGGTARIGARVPIIGPLYMNVYQDVTVYDPSISGASSMKVGDTTQLTLAGKSIPGSWKWTSSNTAMATVSSSGLVTAKGKGTVTITATLSDNANISASKTITVSSGDLSKATVTLSQTSYTYDGTAKKPAISSVKVGANTLTAGTDYAISGYSNNINAGTASVTIYGIGNYSGTATKAFTINKASIASVSLSATSYAYDGKAKNPTVVVYGPKNGKTGQVLSSASDYTLTTPQGRTNAGKYTYTATGKGNYTGTKTATFEIVGVSVQYRTHVQNDGWQSYVKDGATSGTSGKSLRLEGINISLASKPYSGSIQYRTHIQNIGWESSWKSDGAMSGTSGRSLRLEAIQIKLTDTMANYYDVYYRVHAQNVGWMGWAKNGASAGTAAHAYRLEAIQIKIVPKGSAAPGSTSAAYLDGSGYMSGVTDLESSVLYRTHVQNDGWQNYMRDGETAGTSGRSLRLEGINIKLGGAAGSGGIRYRTHIQNIGWESGWKYNGAMSGTSGRGLRLEAIQIELTGTAASKYDVYYRVHAQNFGWMGWAKNGASAGTAGYSYRLEAIQVKLVPKGGSAPGSTAYAYRSR